MTNIVQLTSLDPGAGTRTRSIVRLVAVRWPYQSRDRSCHTLGIAGASRPVASPETTADATWLDAGFEFETIGQRWFAPIDSERQTRHRAFGTGETTHSNQPHSNQPRS